MRQYYFGFLFAVASMPVFVPLPQAVAQTDPAVSGEVWVRSKIFSIARTLPTRAKVLESVGGHYLRAENDGREGISKQDLELGARLTELSQRSAFLLSYWLPYDLDADGVVTRAEIETVVRSRAVKEFEIEGLWIIPTQEQLEKIQRTQTDRLLENFGEGIERITLQDAIAAAGRMEQSRRNRKAKSINNSWQDSDQFPLSLDRNGDSIVSREEFDAAVLEAFARLDTSGDGRISEDELALAVVESRREDALQKQLWAQKLKEQKAEEEFQAKIGNCRLSKVSPDEAFVLISANSARGLAASTIVLDDREDVALVTQIVIEPGSKKLAIALAGFRSTIWRFSGAVERVAHVFVGSPKQHGFVFVNDMSDHLKAQAEIRASAVTGIPENKITFAQQPDCLAPFGNFEGGSIRHIKQMMLTKRILNQLTGREPDQTVAAGRLGTISVPSMRVVENAPYDSVMTLPTDGSGTLLWHRFKEKYPAGIVDIDPAVIVTNGKADRREVLPAQAGLAQLLEQGAIEVTGHSVSYTIGKAHYTVWEENSRANPENVPEEEITRFPARYRIMKKIRIPAGLCDDVFPSFTLAQGVPLPELGTCYPTIFVEETGETLICNAERTQCRK